MTTDFNKLTVVELRAELKKHGLTQAGKKADLVERLNSAVANGSSEDVNKEPADDEQSAEPQDSPRAATSTLEPAEEVLQEPAVVEDEPVADAPKSVDVTFLTEGGEALSQVPEPSIGTDLSQPTTGSIATTTINIAEELGSSEIVPAVAEVLKDAQSRKRRSRTPSIDESVRKRMRPDDPEPTQVDAEMADAAGALEPNGAALDKDDTTETNQEVEELKEETFEPRAERFEPLGQLDGPDSSRYRDAAQYDINNRDDGVMGERDAAPSDFKKPLHDADECYPDRRMVEDGPADTNYGAHDRPVVPSIHPATSAIYIKNFMRPLRPDDVKDYLVELATPPSKEPNPEVVVSFFLDSIKTHAFVNFNSISAASRVRSALHDQVWPDERNRKALWVDFIPPEKVLDWIEREEADGGGRGKLNRWEVMYEADVDGYMTARLEEGGAEPTRPAPKAAAPPTGPASSFIPTGPANTGIEGAPLGPRGRGGRMAPGAPLQGGVNPPEGVKVTRALPELQYRPASEDVVRRRIENMRSFYTKDQYRDMGAVEDINRYTFENVDSFVDRGKEVFVGIRPPHRERERQMRGGGGRGPSGPSAPRRGGPPPPSFRPRGGDRYMGGGGRNNGRGGDSFGPRSRLDGAPLPTYDGPGRSDRRGGGRNGFGGYGR